MKRNGLISQCEKYIFNKLIFSLWPDESSTWSVAQSAEQVAVNHWVGGSSPSTPAFKTPQNCPKTSVLGGLEGFFIFLLNSPIVLKFSQIPPLILRKCERVVKASQKPSNRL